MADVRSSNKDTPTLLHYIALKAETEYRELLTMNKEFVEIHNAAKGALFFFFFFFLSFSLKR